MLCNSIAMAKGWSLNAAMTVKATSLLLQDTNKCIHQLSIGMMESNISLYAASFLSLKAAMTLKATVLLLQD